MDQVLYVDDEKNLLEIGKIFLEENGQYSVRTIDSASAALSLMRETDFDAIISDFQMPGMDGITFLKAVREQSPDIPFILFTGRGREEVVIEAINYGADFYLQKGGDPTAQFAELAHKIRQAVTRRRTRDELRAAYQQLSASDTELREQYRQLALSEQRIRDREKKFRAIFEKTHDALVLFNRDGCIDCNQKAVELFGYVSQEEFLGLTPADTSPPNQPDGQESRAAAAARMETVFEKGTDNFEWVQMKKDGSTFLADVLLSAFELDGQPVFLSSIRDITDRHRAEEELKQSRERLQLALWGAAEGQNSNAMRGEGKERHEIRTNAAENLR
ncbi:MAG: response regulator [Methanoregula sp.]|jgi:PAS domain S-box-containing protein